jgi:hypothetical protein
LQGQDQQIHLVQVGQHIIHRAGQGNALVRIVRSQVDQPLGRMTANDQQRNLALGNAATTGGRILWMRVSTAS